MNVSAAGVEQTSGTDRLSIAAGPLLLSWEVRPALRRRAFGDWIDGPAQDLRDQEFAREFLLAAMDEGAPIQVALGKVIRAMGVKEFAAKVKMAGPNVLRAINTRLDEITTEEVQRLEWGVIARVPCAIKLLKAPKGEASFCDVDEFERLVRRRSPIHWHGSCDFRVRRGAGLRWHARSSGTHVAGRRVGGGPVRGRL